MIIEANVVMLLLVGILPILEQSSNAAHIRPLDNWFPIDWFQRWEEDVIARLVDCIDYNEEIDWIEFVQSTLPFHALFHC